MTRLAPARLVGMAAPFGVWALHFVLVYSLAGLACAEAWAAREWLGVRVFVWAMLLWTAVALAVIGWLGRRARDARRRLDRELETADASVRPELERQCFSARVAVLLAALAAVAVAFTAVPMFVLPHCT